MFTNRYCSLVIMYITSKATIYLVDTLKRFEKNLGFKNEIDWRMSTIIGTFHLLTVYWTWNYALPVKWETVVFTCGYRILASLGVTCGAHRLFAHRSYKVNEPLKAFLLLCYSFTVCILSSLQLELLLSSLQSDSTRGCPISKPNKDLQERARCLKAGLVYDGKRGQPLKKYYPLHRWVRDHRQHHKYSDTEADPHDASRGFFFSHIGWLLTRRNEQVIKCRQQIDVSDIKNDRLIKIVDKHFSTLTFVTTFVLPTFICHYVWGEKWMTALTWQCIRFLEVLHVTFSVNSIAHTVGYKPYNKNIAANESALLSFLTFGEGWHNYHHTFPFDFKAGEHFDVIDLSTILIKWWSRMGWAWDLKQATPAMVENVTKTIGDN